MHKHQRCKATTILAYLLATLSVIMSLTLWTRVITWIVVIDLSIDAAGVPLLTPSISASVASSPSSSKSETSPQSRNEDIPGEKQHAAAAEIQEPEQAMHESANEIQEAEKEQEAREDKPQENVADEEQDELSEWEIARWTSIVIPKIGIHAPVYLPSRTFWDSRQWNLLEEQMQVGLAAGTVAYPHSVSPGRRGSLFIAGHSSPPNIRAEQSAYGHLFARIPELEVGESIRVGSTEYAITGTTIVTANTTAILEQQQDESKLVLITCYPVGTTKNRWVVYAEKVAE